MSRELLKRLDDAKTRSREQRSSLERPGGGNVDEVLPDALHKRLRVVVKEHAMYAKIIKAVSCRHEDPWESMDPCDGCKVRRMLEGGKD